MSRRYWVDPLTLTEAKQEIVGVLQARIRYAREAIANTRALRASDVEESQ